MIRRSHVIDAVSGIAAEALFAILPLVVLTVVLFFEDKGSAEILGSPEWSFGAAVLGGQTLVKFVSGLTRAVRPSWQRVSLVVAALFVFSISPALVILALTISTSHPPVWLVVCQIVMFVLNVVLFFLFGTLGGIWLEREHQPDHKATQNGIP